MVQKVFAYHGTTLRRAKQILSGGFEFSRGAGDWLGEAIYFFEASEWLAWVYARKATREDQATGVDPAPEPAVLTGEIKLDGCIDLFDPEWVGLIGDVSRQLAAADALKRQHGPMLTSAAGKQFIIADYKMAGASFRTNTSDCAVFNALWDYCEDEGIDARCIRAPFVFGRQLFANSFFFHQSHAQIAVTDALLIESLKLLT